MGRRQFGPRVPRPCPCIRAGGRGRSRHYRGERILVVDHHAGIKGQDFKSKQPRVHEGTDNQAPLLSRPIPYMFPGPEKSSRRKAARSGAQREFNFPM